MFELVKRVNIPLCQKLLAWFGYLLMDNGFVKQTKGSFFVFVFVFFFQSLTFKKPFTTELHAYHNMRSNIRFFSSTTLNLFIKLKHLIQPSEIQRNELLQSNTCELQRFLSKPNLLGHVLPYYIDELHK